MKVTGAEIIQPTIVEAHSFLAWKDEAFLLWQKWASLYPSTSPSAAVLSQIGHTYYLINVVDNNYIHDTLFDLFTHSPSRAWSDLAN